MLTIAEAAEKGFGETGTMDPFKVSPSVLARFLPAPVGAGPAFLLARCVNRNTRGAHASEKPVQDIIYEI